MLSYLFYTKGTFASTLFPLHAYWNMSDFTNVINTAPFLCQVRSWGKCCSCADNCFVSKTCCIDILWNQTDPLPLNKYLEMFVQVSKSIKDTTCEKVLPVDSSSQHITEMMLMVHSCQENARVEDKEQCINNSNLYMENIPVFGSDNMLYRNDACARCNSVEYKAVNLTIRCEEHYFERFISELIEVNATEKTTTIGLAPTTKTTRKGLLDEFKKCKIEIKQSNIKNIYMLECQQPLKDRKIVCGKDSPYYDLCNAYSGRFLSYENYDCYRCQNVNLYNLYEDSFQCQEFDESVKAKFSWAVTITIIDKTKVIRKQSGVSSQFDLTKNLCDGDNYFDLFTGKCEKVNFRDSFKTSGLKWQSKKSAAALYNHQGANFDSCLLNHPPALFLFVNRSANITAVQNLFSELTNISNTFSTSLTNKNKSILRLNGVLSAEILQSIRKHSARVLHYASSMIISSVRNQQVTEMYGFDVARSYKGDKLCAYSETTEAIEGNIFATCDFVIDNKTISTDNIVLWINVSSSGNERKLISYCSDFHLQSNCTHQQITSYTVDDNQTLYYNYQNKRLIFLRNEYVPLNKGVGICKNSVETSSWETNLTKIAYFTSIIGTSASLPCYILIVIVYVYFSELRTWASLISTTLCITLLLADATFLVATQVNGVKKWCRAVSVLLHWFLLVAYHCVLYLAFDVAATFGGFNKCFSKCQRLMQYLIVVYTIPFLFVAINVTLDHTGAAHIGYGDNGICWIGGFYAKVFSYIVPIAVIFMSATCFLIFTVFKIKRSETASKKMLGEGRTSCVNVAEVALKLTLILGVIELLGFVQIVKSNLSEEEEIFNSVLGFLFTCCRSLKGIMLFAAYICTNKVKKLYSKTVYNLNQKHKKILFTTEGHSLATFTFSS